MKVFLWGKMFWGPGILAFGPNIKISLNHQYLGDHFLWALLTQSFIARFYVLYVVSWTLPSSATNFDRIELLNWFTPDSSILEKFLGHTHKRYFSHSSTHNTLYFCHSSRPVTTRLLGPFLP